jgi:hypothetical protein
MSLRGLRTVPLVLLLVLAFALGSVSTATATGLTKGAVKKIAAKVVKKQAPSLSVAHAKTATTATSATSATSATTATTAATANDALKVGGLTAAQLGVRPIVFTVPVGPHVVGKVFNLPGVPAGSYLVSLHAVINTTTGSSAECRVQNQTQGHFPLKLYTTAPAGQFPTVSGSGFETVNAGDGLTFACTTVASWTPFYPMHLTFTPVAGVTTRTMTSVKGTD